MKFVLKSATAKRAKQADRRAREPLDICLR
jgi:hypothetical protein